MNKKRTFIIMVIAIILSLFIIPSSYSIYKSGTAGTSSTSLATWNVTLEQTGVNNSLSIVAGLSTANYTLNVKSLSEVDIKYDVVISGLPNGVSVAFDERSPQPASSGTVTITNAGTILYNAQNKINSHTLTFSAVSNATYVNNQSVTVNVIAKQILPS